MHNPPTKVLRCPKLSISQALSNCPTVWPARFPVTIHCARSWPMPKDPMMSGSATLTVVVVTTADIVPSNATTVT